MAERFLILGASSFYGRNFAEYIEQRGDLAIRRGRYEAPYDQCDYVINFCSKSLVVESWQAPEEWVKANAADLSLMVSAMVGERFKKFVHVSTPEVYGDMTPWADEDCRFNPSTPYAVSRVAGDMMLMAYRRAYDFPAVITRTANIYGPGQGKNRIIPLAFETLREGKRLELHGGGHTVRSFIHVRDACAGLYMAAKQGSIGQTYHISTNRLTSIKEIVTMICRQLGKRPEEHIGSQPDRLGKDQTYAMSSEKLRRMGWQDTITLERGLREYGQGT